MEAFQEKEREKLIQLIQGALRKFENEEELEDDTSLVTLYQCRKMVRQSTCTYCAKD